MSLRELLSREYIDTAIRTDDLLLFVKTLQDGIGAEAHDTAQRYQGNGRNVHARSHNACTVPRKLVIRIIGRLQHVYEDHAFNKHIGAVDACMLHNVCFASDALNGRAKQGTDDGGC